MDVLIGYDRDVHSFGDLNMDDVDIAFCFIIFSQLRPQSSRIDSHNGTQAWVKFVTAIVYFEPQTVLTNLTLSALQGHLYDETQKPLHSLGFLEDATLQNCRELLKSIL